MQAAPSGVGERGDMGSPATVLTRNPNFRSLTLEQAEGLLAGAARKTFQAGSTLVREGEPGASMIVLVEGHVDIQRNDKTLATLDPGQTLGEMALLDPGPRSATAVAKTDGVCYEIQRETLWALLAEGDDAAIQVLQGLTSTVSLRLGDVNRLVQEEVLAPRGSVFGRLWAKVGRLGRK